MLPHNVPAHPHCGPVDNLEEGDNTEPEKEAKEAAKRGDELNWPHCDVPLQFYEKQYDSLLQK